MRNHASPHKQVQRIIIESIDTAAFTDSQYNLFALIRVTGILFQHIDGESFYFVKV